MRNESSIKQWASLMLGQEVESLKQIQSLEFIEVLLARIDPDYFQTVHESYADILTSIGQYYREEIGSDLQSQLDSINIFRDTTAVWELLLGIAIKGNNRNRNIHTIFQMDSALQSELMAVVTGIIDKFGKNVSNCPDDSPPNPQDSLMALLDEHDQLKDSYEALHTDYLRQQQQSLQARHELEEQLQKFTHEKLAFIELLSTAGLTKVRPNLDDDHESLFTAGNSLAAIGQDIVQFVTEHSRQSFRWQLSIAQLEEHNHELKDSLHRLTEQLELAKDTADQLASSKKEIASLRTQGEAAQRRESQLLKSIADVEEHNYNLVEAVHRKNTNHLHPTQQSSLPHPSLPQHSLQHSLPQHSLQHSLPQHSLPQHQPQSEKGQLNKLSQEISEAEQPQLLQRQETILQLKKVIEAYKDQNDSLTRANLMLQKSAQKFLQSHEQAMHQALSQTPSAQPHEVVSHVRELLQQVQLRQASHLATIEQLRQAEPVQVQPQMSVVAPEYLEITEDVQDESELDASSYVKSSFFQVNSQIVADITAVNTQPTASYQPALDTQLRQLLEQHRHQLNTHQSQTAEEVSAELHKHLDCISSKYSHLNSTLQLLLLELKNYSQTIPLPASTPQLPCSSTEQLSAVRLAVVNRELKQQLANASVWKDQILRMISSQLGRVPGPSDDTVSRIHQILAQLPPQPQLTLLQPDIGSLLALEQAKNSQLNEELQLMAAVLLEYRNLLESD